MKNKPSDKMTFREFLGKIVPFAMLVAICYALRALFEFGLGYKDVPFLLCAFAIGFLIEAIKTKHLQVICTVIAIELFIAGFYVEQVWLEWGFLPFGIAAIIIGMRGSKTDQSAASSDEGHAS